MLEVFFQRESRLWVFGSSSACGELNRRRAEVIGVRIRTPRRSQTVRAAARPVWRAASVQSSSASMTFVVGTVKLLI